MTYRCTTCRHVVTGEAKDLQPCPKCGGQAWERLTPRVTATISLPPDGMEVLDIYAERVDQETMDLIRRF